MHRRGNRGGAEVAVRAAVLLLGCSVWAAPLRAQCPDGTPPPCRGTGRPAAPAVPLNDQTWLVLPFENTARAADAELIRQASVSQLYAEMSRWSGLRVVSGDRVADLLQQLPVAQQERPGLEAARALARRVGAGRLVLGGYLAAGGRATVTARVYETRTGRALRTVRDPLSGFQSDAALDSLGASFRRLARGILDVPAPADLALAGVGTSSIDAYRAYVGGLDAMNRLDLDSAVARFQRAVRLDSNYALAHFQLYRSSVDPAAGRPHLQAAVRLAATLPQRERAVVEGQGALVRGDRDRLCGAATHLVEADSADVMGWFLTAQCWFDPRLLLEEGRPRLRGDLNRALRAAERAYAAAPNDLVIAGQLIGILSQSSSMQCDPAVRGLCPEDRLYRVSILTSGDSLAVSIGRWTEVRHAPPDLAPAAVAGQVRRLRRARAVAEGLALPSGSWLFNNAVLPQLAIAAGDLGAAEATYGRGIRSGLDTLTAGPSAVGSARTTYFRFRFELALARERVAEFRAYADSLLTRTDVGQYSQYHSLMGRLGERADTTDAGRQYAAWRPILAGLLPAGFDSLEQVIARRLTGATREDFLQLSTLAGFHARRTGPALDTAARHPLKRFQALLARGDVARARTALATFDRELLARDPATPDDGGWVFSAESHLELGDTATAFQRMLEFGRRWPTSLQGALILEAWSFQRYTARLWGRAWLLYGDLAMVGGQRADARRAYRMVAGLWEHADPPLRPLVARARAALAQLGP